jgi:pyrimidine operon attenuation protein/uracil phosphoribosyltransferase
MRSSFAGPGGRFDPDYTRFAGETHRPPPGAFFGPPAALLYAAMTQLLNAQEIQETLEHLARSIAGAAPQDAPLALIGIRRRGEPLARRLVPLLERAGRKPEHFGVLDITLYRDDLTTIGPNAVLRGTEIDFDITGTWMVLVDDVLYTGRSVRAALDALIDLGRPQAIRLASLIDRGRRELPIQPDFVGIHTDTEAHHIVKVKLTEIDGVDEVVLYDRRDD